MSATPVYYDPYMRNTVKNPYPVYRRLREEAPLYYDKQYDFYAVSRYDDVRRGFAIGNVLARLEGRVVFEELLKRIPQWAIDMGHANLSSTPTMRGWNKLPARERERREGDQVESRASCGKMKAGSWDRIHSLKF